MKEFTQTQTSEEFSPLRPGAESDIGKSAYLSSWEHLRDEFSRLDLLIRLELLKENRSRTPNPLDQFKGLILTESEVNDLLEIDDPTAVKQEDPHAERDYQTRKAESPRNGNPATASGQY